MKRYIYIIIGIVVVAVVAVLVLLAIKNNSGSSSLTTGVTPSGGLPGVGTQGGNGSGATSSPQTPVALLGLPSSVSTSSAPGTGGQMTVQAFGVLSSSSVLDYFVNAQNKIIAIEPTGVIDAISNGHATTINSSTISDIISASFSYDGEKILVSYGDPTSPQGGVFDVLTNTWTALPQGILSPEWSPINNYQIAYLVASTNSGGKLALATMNAGNLKAAPSILLTLNANDLDLQWPTQNEFILSDKPTARNAGSVWAFNSTAGTLTPLIYETPSAEGVWSHNSTIPYGLTFSQDTSGKSDLLALQPISGNLPTKTLSFLTLPSKCTFNTELMPIGTSTAPIATSTATSSAKTPAVKTAAPTSTPYLALYCGIPRSSSNFSSASLPDDYNTMALFTSDDIYKINTVTGEEQSLWSDGTQNMDVSDIKFVNNALFFINRYDQRLYGLTFTSG